MNARVGGESNAPTPIGKPSLADFILLNEEIAALVRARVPLESHLARLGAELPRRGGRLAERIGRRLEAGDNLAAAVEAECGSLPAAYRAAIVAGAESGQLASALESLVDAASRLEQMRRVTAIAVLYPLMIIVVASLLFAMVLDLVVPNFNWLYERHFGPFAYLADAPRIVAAIAIVVPTVAVLIAARWWWRSGRLDGASGRFGMLGWLPWVRRVRYWGQAATMADLLRMLIERGLPLDRALRLAADAAGNAKIRAAAGELAAQAERGDALVAERSPDRSAECGVGRPAHNWRPQPEHVEDATGRSAMPLLVRLALRHTSDRRLLSSSLRQAAGLYRERAIRAAEWHAEYLPIVLTIGIGGTLTLGFTLLVFWPYASMLYEISWSNWR
jgi:type II secretory pathway component PulF